MSSHDLSELEQVCDWLVLIDTGRVALPGPDRATCSTAAAAAWRCSPSGAPTAGACVELLRARGHEVGAGRTAGSSCPPAGADDPALAAAVNRPAFDAGMVLVELSPLRTTLEDRYLSMVRRSR